MLEAQEFDEDDEIRREALQGKSVIHKEILAQDGQTASRNSFQLAKGPR